MAVSRQEDLRANQKARTRAALVDAASALLREGAAPTVAEAAERAKVSRATAYRYFPTQEAMLVEIVQMQRVVAPIEAMLADGTDGDVEQRVLRVLDALNGQMIAEEAAMRAALRVYLDTWLQTRRDGSNGPPVREGRRMRWLDEALEPVRRNLSADRYRRLRAALALTVGGDAVVVMKDVCGLENDEVLDVLRWAATAMLRAAIEDLALIDGDGLNLDE